VSIVGTWVNDLLQGPSQVYLRDGTSLATDWHKGVVIFGPNFDQAP